MAQPAAEWITSKSVNDALARVRDEESRRPVRDRLMDAILDAGEHVCIEWGARSTPAHRALWWDDTEQELRAQRGDTPQSSRTRLFGDDREAALRWLLDK